MKHLRKFNESTSKFQEEMEILKDITLDLKDAGLKITVSESDPRFHEKDTIYLKIEDVDKIFCTKWPKDDMDWLHGKPIMLEFYKTLEGFNLVWDKDYVIAGGGPSVTLIFRGKNRKSIKL